MRWSEIRASHPDQWLIVEALEAHTTDDSRRHLDRIAILERCSDGKAAMDSYRRLHREYPQRELYFVHTSREELDIEERRWLGMRVVLDEEQIQLGSSDRFWDLIKERRAEKSISRAELERRISERTAQ